MTRFFLVIILLAVAILAFTPDASQACQNQTARNNDACYLELTK